MDPVITVNVHRHPTRFVVCAAIFALAAGEARAAVPPSVVIGETATGIVAVTGGGDSLVVAFVAQVIGPERVRVRMRYCDSPAHCITAQRESGGSIVADGLTIRVSAAESPLGPMALRASRGREDTGVGTCSFAWSEGAATGRIEFDRYGHAVKAPWDGSLGSRRATAFPGAACDWYVSPGAITMRG